MILYSLVFGIVAIFAGCLLLPTPDVLSGNGAYLPTAYLYMTLCSIGFFLGYLFFSGSRPAAQEECDSNGSRSNRYLQAKHMAILTLVACSGVAVLLLQINSTVGLAEYLNLIRSAQSSDDTNHIRYLTVALGSGDGGLPGYIKVFSENFVVAPLCLLALIARGYKVRHIGNYLLGILIGVLFLFGTLLRMDRLSFLALIPVGISIFVRSKNRAAKIASVGCALSLLLMIVVQSMRRGDGMGMTEWAALYLQLGMVNLGVMIKTNPAFTYGFAGVFSFATLILSVFGVHLLSGTEIYDSIWSPAQNAFGYMFQDFGWFGILFFFIAGSTCEQNSRR